MIEEVRIKNYKSLDKLKIQLGRVNVLIGENGSGKSNILEAIALGSADWSNKMDNEFLSSRGIRVADPRLMRSAFDKDFIDHDIELLFIEAEYELGFSLANKNEPYSKWNSKVRIRKQGKVSSLDELHKLLKDRKTRPKELNYALFKELYGNELPAFLRDNLDNFLIYAPENNKIRNFHSENQVEPIGIHGEGLFKLLKILSDEQLTEIKENLALIDWFEDFQISKDLLSNERRISVTDRYIDDEINYFDQRSTNEGFLFLLFYLTLFVSEYTPKFFAIDNIDNSLNPNLCKKLMKVISDLAKKYDKQVILTTHNASILDGLNLNDPKQKLYVVYRNLEGASRIREVKKESSGSEEPVRLSESFLRGYIGGLNKGGF